MEVLLKKTKITKNILTQISILTLSFDISKLSSLGWCFDGKFEYEIYSDNNGTLVKLPIIKKIEKDCYPVQIDTHGNRKEHFFLKVYFTRGNLMEREYKFNTDIETREKFFEELSRLHNETVEKGQFYL